LEKLIRVRILENEYLIKSDVDEEEVEKIARFVDDKLREIRDNTNGLSDKNIAILAAFDIASEYFQLQKDGSDMVRKLQERAEALNYQIDSVMG
jgi:cell division protein ZapA